MNGAAPNLPRLLVTGASGMLGRAVVTHFCQQARHHVCGWVRRRMEIPFPPEARIDSVELIEPNAIEAALDALQPSVIVHCAARTDVEACERDRAGTLRLHVDATRRLAQFRPDETRFLYVSTDAVFDGQRGNYAEEDETHPLNCYAQTKLLGERCAREMNPAALIVRLNIFGFHRPRGRSLFEWAYGELAEGRAINGFTDAWFNPLYTGHAARAFDQLLVGGCSGLFHCGSGDAVSKYGFLVEMARVFCFDPGLVRPVSIQSQGFSAQRARNTTLDVGRFAAQFGSPPRLREELLALQQDFFNTGAAVEAGENDSH